MRAMTRADLSDGPGAEGTFSAVGERMSDGTDFGLSHNGRGKTLPPHCEGAAGGREEIHR